MADSEIQENAAVSGSPFYFYPLFAAEFVGVEELAMLHDMFVNELGNLDVETAIFSDFHDSLLAPPFDGVDAVGCLAHAESRLSDIIQS